MAVSISELSTHFQKSEPPFFTNQDTGVSVYKARYLTTGQEVVWKQQKCSDSDLAKFIRGTNAQRQLDHPHICRVLASSQSQERSSHLCVLISELADSDLGKEIDKRIKSKRFWTEEELVHMVTMIVSALKACEEREVCHRDLKPANIFINNDGCIKVGDFGLARETEKAGAVYSMAGTLPYFSPKLRDAFGEGQLPEHDPYKSDVYSLGVTILQMATLRLPTELCTRVNLSEIVNQSVESISYSQNFKYLLRSMLTVEETNRVNFSALMDFLETLYPHPEDLQILPPGNAVVVDNPTDTRKCNQCKNSNPEIICICSFPPLVFCTTCANLHLEHFFTEPNHYLFPYSDLSRFNTQAAKDSALAHIPLKERILTELEDSKTQAVACIQSLNARFDQAVLDLEALRRSEIGKVERILRRIESVQSSLPQKLESELCTPLSRVFADLQNIAELPLFELNMNEDYLEGIPRAFNLHIIENVSSLEAAMLPLAFPIFFNNRMRVFRPADPSWELKNISSKVSIDKKTSFAFVNNTIVAGCGGDQAKKQLFTINFNTGEVEVLPSTAYPRTSAGIIHIGGAIYIFGGIDAGRGAEVLKITDRAPVALSSSQDEHFEFNPCEYKGEIYLPGNSIEVYNPQCDVYRTVCTRIRAFTALSSFIFEETLYMFNSTSRFIKLPATSEFTSPINFFGSSITNWSNPAPRCVGQEVFLFAPESQKVQIVNQSMTRIKEIQISK